MKPVHSSNHPTNTYANTKGENLYEVLSQPKQLNVKTDADERIYLKPFN